MSGSNAEAMGEADDESADAVPKEKAGAQKELVPTANAGAKRTGSR